MPLLDCHADAKKERITPVLYSRHWLPVEHRIIFKLLLLTYKALNDFTPKYLSDLIEIYVPEPVCPKSAISLTSLQLAYLATGNCFSKIVHGGFFLQ